ncbi:hypothetical protein Tdes44962_MAKER01287 [Teratosphaeria destructans]|uniref:Uncharacterized protein n=1 Tax=Teratosphaeria destructans TaxID=418781 RepID=A0A9W7T0K2_9PEZI|nr:hypothetical protein Tdes44962_MAKER01287 [Teratosphaeria destructans]
MDGTLTLPTLPREIRNVILERVIISDGLLCLASEDGTTPVLVSATQVMRTCKQIHGEAMDAIQRLQKLAAKTGISRLVPIILLVSRSHCRNALRPTK